LIQQIEIDIQNNLQKTKNLEVVCELLWEKWQNANFDLVSVNSFCSFLFEAGQWDKLILISISQLKKNAPVSWDFLAETLNKVNNEQLKNKTLQTCLDLFQKPDYEIPFLKTYIFDIINPQVHDWRNFYLKKIKRSLDENRTHLIDQLHMFKHSAHFSPYEKNILIKLEKMFPNDPEIIKITEGPKIKEFKAILEKYGNNYSPQSPMFHIDFKAEGKLKNILINECKQLIKDPESNPFDFVYLFIFIDAYDEALQILDRIPISENNNWLMMDLLMLAKRYSQALSWTDFLEDQEQYKYDIEKLSQIYYHRARCLWELDRKQFAIETIENLLQWNPEYRIASHLLYEWKAAV
jgi:hypothetical protein